MPKSSKTFILSEESVNRHGFITRTAGIDLEDFRKNPVLLWMHGRGDNGKKDDVLPLGYWDDIKVENGTITAVPVFDDNDDFAMTIYNKVEHGTVRMASAGLVPVEMAEVEAGQAKLRNPSTGKELAATDKVLALTKSVMQEASLVDIGSNTMCLALYDQNNAMIELKDSTSLITLFTKFSHTQTKPTSDMEKVELKALNAELNLAADATEAQVLAAVQAIKKENADLKEAATNQRNDALVTLAVEKGKITEGMKPQWLKLAASDYEGAKAALDAMPEYKAPSVQLGDAKSEKPEWLKLSWNEIDQANKLEEMKAKYPEEFKLKYKETFNKEYPA